ncbi:MAG: sugar nucleotide-binding protein [Lachnospiraceae bacterium]|nr:sugar nucleotide-binding protein [Lachnospiraceae bacterium]
MQYIILGANGYVGSYIYRHMKKDNLKVIGTGHCREGEKDLVCFDALHDSITNVVKLVTEREKTAIICIAQTNIDQCKLDYDLSRQVNVTFVQSATEKLLQEGFHVIYFSTDNVFDGMRGNYSESDKPNAINQYGKMKQEVEECFLEKFPEVCIFRIPKVLSAEREKQNLLTDFESKLNGEEVRCIKNNCISIIAKEDLYQACLISSKQKMHGLYNLSCGEQYSRKQLAEKFFMSIGVDYKKIVELELEKFGFSDARPLNIGLDNSKFRKATGYEFITYDMLLDQYRIVNGYGDNRKTVDMIKKIM